MDSSTKSFLMRSLEKVVNFTSVVSKNGLSWVSMKVLFPIPGMPIGIITKIVLFLMEEVPEVNVRVVEVACALIFTLLFKLLNTRDDADVSEYEAVGSG